MLTKTKSACCLPSAAVNGIPCLATEKSPPWYCNVNASVLHCPAATETETLDRWHGDEGKNTVDGDPKHSTVVLKSGQACGLPQISAGCPGHKPRRAERDVAADPAGFLRVL